MQLHFYLIFTLKRCRPKSRSKHIFITPSESFFHLWQQTKLGVRYKWQSGARVVCSCRSARIKVAIRVWFLVKIIMSFFFKRNCTYLPTRWIYDSAVFGKSKLITLATFWKSTPLDTPYSLSLALKRQQNSQYSVQMQFLIGWFYHPISDDMGYAT